MGTRLTGHDNGVPKRLKFRTRAHCVEFNGITLINVKSFVYNPNMFTLFLAASQQLPPISVTVQQPPSWPVWLTTLFSAGVGAALGIGSSILMEYVKPLLAKRREKKLVVGQIGAELMENLSAFEAAQRIFQKAETKNEKQVALMIAWCVSASIKTTRFKLYAEKYNDLVHEVDPDSAIAGVYEVIQNLPATMREQSEEMQFDFAKSFFGTATEVSNECLQKNNLPYKPSSTLYERIYTAAVSDKEDVEIV